MAVRAETYITNHVCTSNQEYYGVEIYVCESVLGADNAIILVGLEPYTSGFKDKDVGIRVVGVPGGSALQSDGDEC